MLELQGLGPSDRDGGGPVDVRCPRDAAAFVHRRGRYGEGDGVGGVGIADGARRRRSLAASRRSQFSIVKADLETVGSFVHP